MTESVEIRVLLEPDGDRLAGVVIDQSGRRRLVGSWLELMAALEAARSGRLGDRIGSSEGGFR